MSQCDELSAAGGVLGGMGVQRLMTLGNQSSSPLQMGTRGGRDLPPSRWDEDPAWRGEDPPPPRGGELLLTRIIAFIITDHHINRELIPPGMGKIHLPPAATISMFINHSVLILSYGLNFKGRAVSILMAHYDQAVAFCFPY